MLNDQQLAEALAKSPAPRVHKEHIEQRIKAVTYHQLFNIEVGSGNPDELTAEPVAPTVTICNIELDNGYSVRGESACVNPANYNKEIVDRIAYDDAFKKLWPLFGFLLAEYNFLNGPTPDTGTKVETQDNVARAA